MTLDALVFWRLFAVCAAIMLGSVLMAVCTVWAVVETRHRAGNAWATIVAAVLLFGAIPAVTALTGAACAALMGGS